MRITVITSLFFLVFTSPLVAQVIVRPPNSTEYVMTIPNFFGLTLTLYSRPGLARINQWGSNPGFNNDSYYMKPMNQVPGLPPLPPFPTSVSIADADALVLDLFTLNGIGPGAIPTAGAIDVTNLAGQAEPTQPWRIQIDPPQMGGGEGGGGGNGGNTVSVTYGSTTQTFSYSFSAVSP